MEKKFLVTAMGAVLAGAMGLAQAANVTLYGNVNIAIDAVDQDGGSDDINMESRSSSIGVKGSEDLGGGLKAIFQAEWQFDADERQQNIVDRDQWVGLKGTNWGKVRFGTISTAYKSTGAKLDPLYRTSLQGRGRSGVTLGCRGCVGGPMQSQLHAGADREVGGRLQNHIRYDSPSWSGVSFIVDYSLDDDDADDGDDTYGGAIRVYWHSVSREYFETLGVPVHRGRLFDGSDQCAA